MAYGTILDGFTTNRIDGPSQPSFVVLVVCRQILRRGFYSPPDSSLFRRGRFRVLDRRDERVLVRVGVILEVLLCLRVLP